MGNPVCAEEQLRADMQRAKDHIQSGSNPQVAGLCRVCTKCDCDVGMSTVGVCACALPVTPSIPGRL